MGSRPQTLHDSEMRNFILTGQGQRWASTCNNYRLSPLISKPWSNISAKTLPKVADQEPVIQLALDKPDTWAVLKTLRLLQAMSWDQLQSSKGLGWELIQSRRGRQVNGCFPCGSAAAVGPWPGVMAPGFGCFPSTPITTRPIAEARGGSASGVCRQPGGQIGRALEVEQGIGQGFQLLQRQRLDAGGGGLAQGPQRRERSRRVTAASPSLRPLASPCCSPSRRPSAGHSWAARV